MQTLQTVTLFEKITIETKQLSLRELAVLLSENYDKIGSISHYCIFVCALRKLEMIDLTYDDLAAILKKFFSLKNIQIKTTGKSIAFYTSKINKGEIDIYKAWPKSSRVTTSKLIDSELDDIFAGL